MKIINDNIHGCISLNDICIKIIDTQEFQRLRDIKQLGTCNYVFPTATHTRFEHSIGVSYLATELLNILAFNQPELNISKQDIINVEIAGLCHDLGHCVLSHAFDKEFINKYYPDEQKSVHEWRSRMILENIIKKYNIIELYDHIETIQEMICPSKYHESFLYHIIANSKNSIDVDKFDYICRDNQIIGLKYSFDYKRIFKQSRIIDNELCFRDKEAYNLYDIFHCRYRNHKMIYNHPIVKAIEYMLIDVLHLSNNHLKLSDSILSSDSMLINSDFLFKFIEFSNNNELINAKKILINLHNRKIYKFIGEINNIQIQSIINFTLFDFNNKLNLLLNKHNFIENKDYIIQFLKIGYSDNNKNPINNIFFYDINNLNIKFKLDKNKVSNLLPNNHNEQIIRLFCKNLDNFNIIKDLFNNFINNNFI
jgi:HD superfamily phosphohydrolase